MNHILIVDDKEENLYYLEALLTGHGYTVEKAHHGAEALFKARQKLPGLVISDLLMPVMDGYTMLRHWKSDARLKAVPFVVYTATYTEAEDERLAMSLGADAFILKPAEPEDFLSRIRDVQSNNAAAIPTLPRFPIVDEKDMLKVYSETLIRKLEEKTLQLEESNRALQQDIAERKAAEENLRESEERFRATFEQAAVGIAHVGLDGHFQRVNDRLCAITGYGRAELLELTFADLTLPEDRAGSDAARVAMLDRELPTYTAEKRYQRKGGHLVWVSVVTTLFRDPQGEPQYFITVITDITARKNLEEQFLRAQRIESIGTLASGIAHDLNNVLAPILMSIALLKLKVPDKPELHRQLDQLGANTERGANLVRHLLTFGRGFMGERLPLQPKHIAREIAELVKDTFPKNITLDFTSEAAPWNIIGDPTQLHQILLNLCVNARDAMPQGGRLSLHLGNAHVDGTNPALQQDAKPGPYVVLTVADTGSGIPQAIREKIFDPFFTTKESGKGTGLGLSTTLALVRSHGGFLELQSEEGKGTTFKISLPANTDEVPAIIVPEAAQLEGRNELVLVVDDEAVIREVARNILEKFGYQVLLAVDGVDAVAQYALHHEKVATVITDMAMPIMGGPATILALRGINPEVKVIASSGSAADTVRKEAGAAGANISDFIPKPYTAEQLLKAVRKVIHEGNRAPLKPV